jgi:hypothetical protein
MDESARSSPHECRIGQVEPGLTLKKRAGARGIGASFHSYMMKTGKSTTPITIMAI